MSVHTDMGIFSFARWLNEHEEVQVQVARYLEAMLDKMAKDGNFHDFILPDNLPDGIAGQPVHFVNHPHQARRAMTLHRGGHFAGFVLNIGHNDLDALKMAVHHEAEHIFHPGTQANGDALAYMADEGEIRGHAREIAKAYAQHFPGQPFDPDKARSLPSLNQTHLNYLNRKSLERKAPEVYQRFLGYLNEFLPDYL